MGRRHTSVAAGIPQINISEVGKQLESNIYLFNVVLLVGQQCNSTITQPLCYKRVALQAAWRPCARAIPGQICVNNARANARTPSANQFAHRRVLDIDTPVWIESYCACCRRHRFGGRGFGFWGRGGVATPSSLPQTSNKFGVWGGEEGGGGGSYPVAGTFRPKAFFFQNLKTQI